MCGLVGVVGLPGAPREPLQDEVLSGLVRLGHRGPHGRGFSTCRIGGRPVVVGGARLEIVGGPGVVVPYRDEATKVTVAFNGELYNHRPLRAELSDGIPWVTSCDTEVIARAWGRWGPGMLDHFNGMFAIVVVDQRQGVVFLARDRAGQKPLYWTGGGDEPLWFASEIKALPGQREECACPAMELLEFDCGSVTPFAGVHAVDPGTCHQIHPGDHLRVETTTWWQLPIYSPMEQHTDRVTAEEELLALLVDAVKLRATADVPMSLLLSGGLDSAIIQAIAQEQHLYCCDFDGVDNITGARLASFGRHDDVQRVTFGPNDVLEDLRSVAWHLDTPATWTALCHWHLARQIAADGGRVVLSGEGADELFGGYTRYRLLWHLDRAASDPHLEPAYRPTRDQLLGPDLEVLARMLDRSGGGPEGPDRDTARHLVARHGGSSPLLVDRMARVDFYTTMQVLLRMADRMMAAHSLENRSPFLDHRVMEWAARCPASWKITERESKSVLRNIARQLGVYKGTIDERTKRGLFIPWQAWRSQIMGSTVETPGARGAWDRSGFATLMREAWRSAFFGAHPGPDKSEWAEGELHDRA